MRTETVLLLLVTAFSGSHGSNKCLEPQDRGTCRKYVAKYFYDKQNGQCRRFWYGGCGGNANKFDSLELCEQTCINEKLHQDDADNDDQNEIPDSEVLFGITNNVHSSVPDLCQLQSDSGSCRNYTIKWFFDSKKQDCERFWYGGCQGNENRFDDSESCKSRCFKASNTGHVQMDRQNNNAGQDAKIATLCQEPKDAGTCKNYTLHWHFEIGSGSCSQFWYGGCGGNSNRFTSQDECEAKCIKGERPVPEARPVNTGTGCANSKYGCCPDQQMAAEGPSYEGCKEKCESSDYGCCIDGQTPAEGPNQEGCDINSGNVPCEQTEHGCCVDGITTALGPLFKGCSDTPDTESRHIGTNDINTAHATGKKCTAPESRDVCTEYEVKWRFDNQKQECVRHWWGGCAVNGNVFESKEKCDAECKNTVVITHTVPPKQGKCTAPESRNLCTKYLVKWRFDNQKQECVRHWWGGCEDNGNVFESQGDCEATCMNTLVIMNPDTVDPDFVNICDMPKDTGPCKANVRRYYYDPRDRRCNIFYYGGCQGNENNFVEVEDCQRECVGDVGISHTTTTTAIPIKKTSSGRIYLSGPSTAERGSTISIRCSSLGPPQPTEVKWFFNGHAIKAEDSDLSINTFVDPQLKHGLISDLVIKNIDQGDAGNYFCRVRPNELLERMHITVVEGRGTTESTEQRDPSAVCLMTAAPGPCYASIQRWHYDHQSGSCLQFVYGGCEGNDNNFETLEECRNICNHKEVCLQSSEAGPCRAAHPRFYFDSQTRSCRSFIYGGCEGNVNNFATKEACDKKCHHYTHSGSHVNVVNPNTDKELNVCQLKPEKGNCRGYNIKWYYMADRNLCTRFVYTGCDGNGNQFDSEQECSDTCVKVENKGGRDSQKQTFPPAPTTESTVLYPKISTVSVQKGASGDHKLVLVKLGVSTVLTCTLRSHGVLWYHNGYLLSSSSKFQVYNNGTLILLSATEDMSGMYSCGISHGHNVPHLEKFKVEVYVPPRIIPGPVLISIKPGDMAILHCQAVGSPQPVISWTRGGHVLLTNSHHILFVNGTLIIHKVLIHDAGEYECSAKNGIAATRKKVTLNIKETVGADIQRHKGIFTEGETIKLHCKGTGYPTPQLEWLKEGIVLESDGKVSVSDGDLTVTSATIEDAGMYKCVAFNDRGRAEDVTTVQITFHNLPTNCEDTMGRTKCHLIVTGRLCGFRIFTSKCCHSCRKAGFL